MQVLLENIAFNHDEDLSKTGSFFLRRNETQIVPIPEWSNESCANPECAPAGYVISKLPATLTIKASFLCEDPPVTPTQIRALESGSNILGPVKAMPVTFHNRRSILVTFDLPYARSRIIAAGISVRDVTWDWQFSNDGKNWADFQTTEHRIYTVVEMPNEPWKPRCNKATEVHVPWTEVLDYACEWAAGIKDLDPAAESITRNVYRLGQEKLVRWDGCESYAHDRFDCTAFLRLLKRQIGKRTLNCDDCATIVSTFSNVLGCNLFQSNMSTDFFTNPILLIGHDIDSIQRFFYHAVAWKLDCDAKARLFDSCLQVDGDENPSATQSDHEFIQPANIIFGTTRSNSYKFRLFDRGKCDPCPDTKQQRLIGSGPLVPRITDIGLLSILKSHYKFDDWDNDSPSSEVPSKAFSQFDFQFFRDVFDDWKERTLKEFEDERFRAIEVLLKRPESSQEFIEIMIYAPRPVESPNDFLLQLLGKSEALHFERLKEPVIGDVSFVGPEGATVVFRRGSFVTFIRSVGIQQTSVIAMASEVDFRLQKALNG